MFRETEIVEGTKAKRHSRHLTITSIIGIALAIFIYNLQDYVTPFVQSNDICKSDNILEISLWILPRVNAHCNELLHTVAGNHKSANIAIVIDLYVGGVFVYMISINIAHLMSVSADEYLNTIKGRWHKISKKSHSTLLIISPFLLIFMFFSFEAFYYGHPLMPEEGDRYVTRSFSILHSHIGLGAATQICAAFTASCSPHIVYMLWLLIKEDMKRGRKMEK